MGPEGAYQRSPGSLKDGDFIPFEDVLKEAGAECQRFTE